MKILVLLVALLSGCADNFHTTLKFKAGDEVTTTSTFYSNCDGRVVSYSYYTNQKGPRYGVDFYCPNIGWTKDIQILETELRRKEK